MFSPSIYDRNDITEDGEVAYIHLRDKHGSLVGKAIIDVEDIQRCVSLKWYMRKGHGNTNYVMAKLPDNKKVFLHRYILGYEGFLDVDHINRDGMDNRKQNLRIVTHAINTANTSKSGVKSSVRAVSSIMLPEL